MPEKKKTNLKRFKDVAAKDVVFNNPRADREFPMHAPDPEYINKKKPAPKTKRTKQKRSNKHRTPKKK